MRTPGARRSRRRLPRRSRTPLARRRRSGGSAAAQTRRTWRASRRAGFRRWPRRTPRQSRDVNEQKTNSSCFKSGILIYIYYVKNNGCNGAFLTPPEASWPIIVRTCINVSVQNIIDAMVYVPPPETSHHLIILILIRTSIKNTGFETHTGIPSYIYYAKSCGCNGASLTPPEASRELTILIISWTYIKNTIFLRNNENKLAFSGICNLKNTVDAIVYVSLSRMPHVDNNKIWKQTHIHTTNK